MDKLSESVKLATEPKLALNNSLNLSETGKLTDLQVEILRLMGLGLSNGAIAKKGL